MHITLTNYDQWNQSPCTCPATLKQTQPTPEKKASEPAMLSQLIRKLVAVAKNNRGKNSTDESSS